MWRIFRGCGHSFHIECNLPDISICSVCEATIQSKVNTLGKTANEAVTKFVNGHDDGETSDDNDEAYEDDDENDDDLADEEVSEEMAVGNLILKIGSWHHVEPPRH